MKIKCFFAAICALMFSFTSSGEINPSKLALNNNPLSSTEATELLSKVYMHHQSLLSNSVVKIIDVQTSERFTSSGNNLRTILICSVNNEKLPNEYYAITFNGKDIVDGAMLGHNGDSKILTIKIPRDEIIYRPSPKINFEFNGDTIKAIRTYQFFTTAKGGNWFIKEGTIYNPFVVSSGGTIYQLHPTAIAIREDGDANYLSKNHKLPTYSKTEGEYFPYGMNILIMAQTPANKTLDIEHFNKEADRMLQIVEKYGEDAPETPETLCVMEFAKWSFNLGMRHSKEFLTWIAKNPNEEKFTHFIQAVATENENNELDWLKEQVKCLKDKKARKWWEKWMKNNL